MFFCIDSFIPMRDKSYFCYKSEERILLYLSIHSMRDKSYFCDQSEERIKSRDQSEERIKSRDQRIFPPKMLPVAQHWIESWKYLAGLIFCIHWL